MPERSPEENRRELDERCAHALGYITFWGDGGFGETLYLWDKEAIRDGNGARNCHLLGARWERVRVDGEIHELMVRLCPAFSARLEDAKILEDEIARRGLREPYCMALWEATGIDGAADFETSLGWPLIRATPEQRARAFVKVVERP